MPEAVAHMRQLIDLGCAYWQAVHDTVMAFEISQWDLVEQYNVKFP